jgi:hypothetical protein
MQASLNVARPLVKAPLARPALSVARRVQCRANKQQSDAESNETMLNSTLVPSEDAQLRHATDP